MPARRVQQPVILHGKRPGNARSDRRAFDVIVMESGSGKSTIGSLLARELGFDFQDGDQFHPAANVEKMHAHP
jgi:hypothetical protein